MSASGPEGQDTLVSVEKLEFIDTTIETLRLDYAFLVNTFTVARQRDPAAPGLTSGGSIAAWAGRLLGVPAQRCTAEGERIGAEFLLRSNVAGAAGESSLAAAAAGGFLVIWTGFTLDGTWDVRTRRFAADGMPTAPELRVNNHLATRQETPDVAVLSAGGFVVAWATEDQDGSAIGNYA